jgi:hypothetical protein
MLLTKDANHSPVTLSHMNQSPTFSTSLSDQLSSAGCEKNMLAHLSLDGSHVLHNDEHSQRMLKKAAASEEPRRTLGVR